jgi:hypothetical protein
MIISLFIYLLVAAVMIGIGVSQLKSRAPVGFYTGEKPPTEEELTDVAAWNKKHGTMWVMYGAVLILSWIAGYMLCDEFWQSLCMIAGVCVPLVLMALYHHALVNRYRR